MKNSESKNIYHELKLLEEVSKTLTETLNSHDIVSSLSKVFAGFIKQDNLNIYIYDDNTRTLRDFSKSWVVIDEFHKNTNADKLYLALAQLGKYEFFVNKDGFAGEFNFSEIKFDSKINTIIFPLKRKNKPYGLIEFEFSEEGVKKLSKEIFAALKIAAYQISLKIQNSILSEQMQTNINFHDSMKNIAKIIETQYELTYIIPLIGEMMDKFVPSHLIYIFLKNEETSRLELFWPKACRSKKILSTISKINAKSKYVLANDDKIGVFPLVGENTLLGCVVAHSNIDKLTKNEIEYLDQLTKQASTTISRANVYAEILQHATLDALTGLNNRRQLEIRIKQEVATAKRQNKSLCVMMIDVDFFKKVNDTYGHVVGDTVLKSVSNIIKAEIREYDIASRYGGEEFSVLLPYTKIEEAFAVAQRLRQAVESTQVTFTNEEDKQASLSVTISIGVYEYKKSDTHEDLYKNADKALYEAKTHGRNKVVIYR